MSPADNAQGAQEKFVGLARPVDGACAGADTSGLEGLSIHWELPSEGESFTGFGVAAERFSVGSADALREAEAAARTLEWLGEAPDVPGPFWGGVAFDPSRPSEERWAAFGSARWILPETGVASRGGKTFLVAFAAAEGAAEDVRASLAARLDALQAKLSASAESSILFGPPAAPMSVSSPASAAWRALMAEALQVIGEGGLSKVVLARPLDVSLPRPFVPGPVLDALRRRQARCAVFLVRATDGTSFLGATPETLLRVREGWLQTEALAATLPRDATLEQATDKEWREHLAVVDAIRAALAGRVLSLRVDEAPSLVRLARLSHLRTGIEATLTPEASLTDLALALHPTPAVAGEPRPEAMAFLRQREGFDRGWYAGIVGYVGRGEAHLRVALRSALVKDRQARLFVGAGIVAGSTAEAEWAETCVKATAMLEALEGHVREGQHVAA